MSWYFFSESARELALSAAAMSASIFLFENPLVLPSDLVPNRSRMEFAFIGKSSTQPLRYMDLTACASRASRSAWKSALESPEHLTPVALVIELQTASTHSL